MCVTASDGGRIKAESERTASSSDGCISDLQLNFWVPISGKTASSDLGRTASDGGGIKAETDSDGRKQGRPHNDRQQLEGDDGGHMDRPADVAQHTISGPEDGHGEEASDGHSDDDESLLSIHVD